MLQRSNFDRMLEIHDYIIKCDFNMILMHFNMILMHFNVIFAPEALFRRGGCTATVIFGLCPVDFVEVFEARLKKTLFEF